MTRLSRPLKFDPQVPILTHPRPQANLLVDHSDLISSKLLSAPEPSTIHFINDNAGLETIMDLVLIDVLLSRNIAQRVICNVKAFPTFVSDSMPKDFLDTITSMESRPERRIAESGSRLRAYHESGRLDFKPDPFWNSGKFFWDLPESINQDLRDSAMTIIKGDANYRRLLGDSIWAATVSLSDATPFFPGSFVALRTLKSNPIVGLPEGMEGQLEEADPKWRVNGKRGVIQCNFA